MFFHKWGLVNFILYVNVIYCLLILSSADAIAQEGVKARRGKKKRGKKKKGKPNGMTSEPYDHNCHWGAVEGTGHQERQRCCWAFQRRSAGNPRQCNVLLSRCRVGRSCCNSKFNEESSVWKRKTPLCFLVAVDGDIFARTSFLDECYITPAFFLIITTLQTGPWFLWRPNTSVQGVQRLKRSTSRVIQ